MTSFATVTTIVVFGASDQLSLHHCTVATSLLSVTLIPIWIASRTRTRSPGIFLAQGFRTIAYFGIRFWIFLQMPCLGSSPECNLCTRYSLFGIVSRIVTPFNRYFRFFVDGTIFFFFTRGHIWFFGCKHFLEAFPASLDDKLKTEWISYLDKTYEDSSESNRLWLEEHPKQLGSAFAYLQRWLDDTTPVALVIKQRRATVPFRNQEVYAAGCGRRLSTRSQPSRSRVVKELSSHWQGQVS